MGIRGHASSLYYYWRDPFLALARSQQLASTMQFLHKNDPAAGGWVTSHRTLGAPSPTLLMMMNKICTVMHHISVVLAVGVVRRIGYEAPILQLGAPL